MCVTLFSDRGSDEIPVEWREKKEVVEGEEEGEEEELVQPDIAFDSQVKLYVKEAKETLKGSPMDDCLCVR